MTVTCRTYHEAARSIVRRQHQQLAPPGLQQRVHHIHMPIHGTDQDAARSIVRCPNPYWGRPRDPPLWTVVPNNALSLSLRVSESLSLGTRPPHRHTELTCQPILSRHYASMTQYGLQIAGVFEGRGRGCPPLPHSRILSSDRPVGCVTA